MSEGEADDTDDGGRGRGRDWSVENWGLIAVFVGLTIVGVALATGSLGTWVLEPDSTLPVTGVPLYVYLHASLGALGYAFTRLTTRIEDFSRWGQIEELAEMLLRIPAAWLLATGVFVLLPLFAGGVTGAGANATSVPTAAAGTGAHRLNAGVAFLVGLYVNMTYKALGSVADRLLGRGRRPSEGERDGTADGGTDGSGGESR